MFYWSGCLLGYHLTLTLEAVIYTTTAQLISTVNYDHILTHTIALQI